MKKRKFAALLAGVLCATCLLAGTITAAAQEPSGGVHNFLYRPQNMKARLTPETSILIRAIAAFLRSRATAAGMR